MQKQLIAALSLPALALSVQSTPSHGHTTSCSKTCVVDSSAHDASYAIERAFRDCGHETGEKRGKVVFKKNEIYNVRRVMNTTGLTNVDVEIHGTLLWDTNIHYWLNNSLPVGYQNQSTAWIFGGENVHWTGFGYGTLDGNGQVWYDFINGTNNYPGRPHQISYAGMKNSVIEKTRFVQSQMWTMTVIHSENVLLEDMYVNSTDANREVGFDFSSLNTDGADVIYSNNITFRNWTVDCGDDNISTKANSTNILIENQDWYTGLGYAMGSIGQYDGKYETVENVTVRNVTVHDRMRYAAYFKTWTGVSRGYPPNGGGGGLGYAANITLSDFKLHNTSGIFAITQYTSYNDARGECDTSKFNIRDVTLENWAGTTTSAVLAELQCSGASPCTGIKYNNVSAYIPSNNTMANHYLCGNVSETIGFECTDGLWEENNR
ncbi:family 28 glycoside hydrolase [Nemania abortiva]|nr:family 28 glycoside hydrolase [Nemania abortiva]